MIAGSVEQLDALQPGLAHADLQKDLGKLIQFIVLCTLLIYANLLSFLKDFACPSDPNALKMIQTM